jgi:mRNA-degrading endonuclease toxin of MazEF toxin-antitoxin module
MLIDPSEGEVWQVQFSPQEGAELREQHPAVVISRAGVGRLPLRIVVPITDAPRPHLWLVPLRPTAKNGLTKSCFADGFQCKSVSLTRFIEKRGEVSRAELSEIRQAVAICIGL